MKKIFAFLFAFAFIFASCIKPYDLEVIDNGVNHNIQDVQAEDYIIINNDDINLEIESDGGDVTIGISSNNDWSAISNASWCHIINHDGKAFNDNIVNISCDENCSISVRMASIIFKAGEKVDTTYITQKGVKGVNSITINTEGPGTLYSILYEKITGEHPKNVWGNEIWNNIHAITINGEIDARDFNTIKWNLQKIKYIDISNCTIKHYEGEYGTNEGYYDGGIYSVYEENQIPIGSFFYWMTHLFRPFPNEFIDEGMISIRGIKLPEGITTINRNAFARAYSLKEVNIPEGVTEIGMVAFRYCTSIKVLTLPSTLTTIGWLCFTDMYSLKEVHIKAENVPEHNQAFGNYPDSDNRGYVVVGDSNYREKTDATLYVPKGQLEKYTEAWGQYFDTIVEEDV